LAFGLATAVAFADQRATKAELGLLKTFQAALGISEEEVIKVVEVVEAGGSLSEALGEPLERLYAEVMVMMTAADGKVKPEEARAMVESPASGPLFDGGSAERGRRFGTEAVTNLAEEGLHRRIQVLASGLTTRGRRLKAYRLAAQVAHAAGPGTAASAEQR